VIDLDYTRERMLADIQAAEPDAGARLVLRGRSPAELLPELNAALAQRLADVPAPRLERDLLAPLKKAVGNAHKRGNRLDPGKWITVELVLTPAGAFVEVADEGAGFDVAATCAALQAGQAYFAHKGSGFRKYAKARSVISFADGGRRFRARFLRASGG
jgi:hypothetical protein